MTLHATTVWTDALTTAQFSYGVAEFRFNISAWLWDNDLTQIWSCTRRCSNSLWNTTRPAAAFDGRYEPTNFPDYAVQSVSWQDSNGRLFRILGMESGVAPLNSAWMRDEIGWRSLRSTTSTPAYLHLPGLSGVLQRFQYPRERRAPNWFVDTWGRPWMHLGLSTPITADETTWDSPFSGTYVFQPDLPGVNDVVYRNPNSSLPLYRFALIQGLNLSYQPPADPGERLHTLNAYDADAGLFYMFSGGSYAGNTSDLWVASLNCHGSAPQLQVGVTPANSSRCDNGRFALVPLSGASCILLDDVRLSTSAPLPVMIPDGVCPTVNGSISLFFDSEMLVHLLAGNMTTVELFQSSTSCGSFNVSNVTLTGFNVSAIPCVRPNSLR